MSDNPHFELCTWRDLLQKAKHDFNVFDKSINSYNLYNLLCTLNHIYDWAKEDKNIKKELPDRKIGDLRTVRLLCNRAKHFKKQHGKEIAPNTLVKKGFGIGRFGKALYGVGEPSYLVDIDGFDVSVLEICKNALLEWEEFEKNHLQG